MIIINILDKKSTTEINKKCKVWFILIKLEIKIIMEGIRTLLTQDIKKVKKFKLKSKEYRKMEKLIYQYKTMIIKIKSEKIPLYQKCSHRLIKNKISN